MHSNDQPQVYSKKNTMTLLQRLEPFLGQDQNIIENIATKIADSFVNLVAKQVVEESILKKLH